MTVNIKDSFVIDLSAWEKDCFWDRQAFDPPLLVIARLTLGKSYQDGYAASHLAGARSIGSKVGVYHFLEYNDIQGQIDNFLNAARAIGALVDGRWTLDVPPILDVEKEPRKTKSRVAALASAFAEDATPKRGRIPAWDNKEPRLKRAVKAVAKIASSASTPSDPEGTEWANQIKTWLDAVATATGTTPILPEWIYTSLYYWKFTFDRNGNPPPWTDNYRLWVAQYFDDPNLHDEPSPLPAGWFDDYLWQYYAALRIPLCPYDGVDANKGSAQLSADLGKPPEPPPNPEPEPGEPSMYKYKIVAQNPGGTRLEIRAGHSSGAADIGDLINGQEAQGDELYTVRDAGGNISEQWLAVKEVRGALFTPQPAWVAVFWSGRQRCVLTENQPPQPVDSAPTLEQTLTVTYDDGTVKVYKFNATGVRQ